MGGPSLRSSSLDKTYLQFLLELIAQDENHTRNRKKSEITKINSHKERFIVIRFAVIENIRQAPPGHFYAIVPEKK